MMFNIFLSGKAGVGKSYIANYLQDKYGYKLAKFANPVYMIAEKYFNMKGKDRKLLQYLGTEIARNEINQNYWIEQFLDTIYIVERTYQDLYNQDVKFVVDDCRFADEAEALLKEGWIGIYLDTPDEIRFKRLENRDGTAQIETLNHSSETQFDSFKDKLLTLDTSRTIEQAYEKLEELMEYIRQEKLYEPKR